MLIHTSRLGRQDSEEVQEGREQPLLREECLYIER